MRRRYTSREFNRPWLQFDDTFGNLETDNSDYWLGNDNIHSMTRTKRFVLRFELTYRGGVNKTFELRGFTLGPKSTNYSMQYNRDSLIGGKCKY